MSGEHSCQWCCRGRRVGIIEHLRNQPHTETRAVAAQHMVSAWYVQQIRKEGRRRGCLPPAACPCGVPTAHGGRCGACARRVQLHQWAAHNRWRWNERHSGVSPWRLPPIGAAYVVKEA